MVSYSDKIFEGIPIIILTHADTPPFKFTHYKDDKLWKDESQDNGDTELPIKEEPTSIINDNSKGLGLTGNNYTTTIKLKDLDSQEIQ